ncbi:pheromone-regulated protein prm10 [Leucoagaricus gongylophorus]
MPPDSHMHAPPHSDRETTDPISVQNRSGNRYTFSSYNHPSEIPPPNDAAGLDQTRIQTQKCTVTESEDASDKIVQNRADRIMQRRGYLTGVKEWYASINDNPERESTVNEGKLPTSTHERRPTRPRYMARGDSMYSFNSLGSDFESDEMPEEPPNENGRGRHAEDLDDLEKNTLRQMDYKTRRKHMMRIKIEYNITSMINRQDFLTKLARALMTFGAPSHRIESQLIAAARILEVEAEFIHFPGVIICSFGDQELGTSETHFLKCGGRLSLGALHKVHQIYRDVVHDEISAKKAVASLDALLEAPPVYSVSFRCFLAFCLSALICPLAFGGSFVDMWIAGVSAFVLSVLQLCVATKSALYTNVFELITVAILVSFAARGLSAIRSQIFCYTAISSSGIIGILPGYLILISSLELASKNIVCGSVKMVYALIYTLFLGFGLQIGSDFYLLLDPSYRAQLEEVASSISSTISLSGTWVADNSTTVAIPLIGTWTFNHNVSPTQYDIIDGCFRPKRFSWYLQPFPTWTSFIIVPMFSLLSSLANLQPFRSKQLPVMVIISCCSYASNKIANHYIFNRSDIVSAIGAFTVGLLGNIYSRRMGGTAFTSMVTGVLFLVPSGLSYAGGITANGNGIDIGGAMIAVTIGITVGLFMSQALVYTFGNRKNAAVFSF